MQPVLHINPMFSDSREDLGRSPKSTSQPTRPPMPSAAEAYVVTAAVTLPDAGNLFQPMSRVIAESSPEHMRKRAAELCLSTTFLDRPYLTGLCPSCASSTHSHILCSHAQVWRVFHAGCCSAVSVFTAHRTTDCCRRLACLEQRSELFSSMLHLRHALVVA